MTALVVGGPRSVSWEGTSLVNAFLFRDIPQFSWGISNHHFLSFFDAPLLSLFASQVHFHSALETNFGRAKSGCSLGLLDPEIRKLFLRRPLSIIPPKIH